MRGVQAEGWPEKCKGSGFQGGEGVSGAEEWALLEAGKSKEPVLAGC